MTHQEFAKMILPVVQGAADGKQVQRRIDGGHWYDYDAQVFCDRADVEYRLKPEKKVMWVNAYAEAGHGYGYKSKYLADECSGDRVACIRIEYEEGEGL